jgi:glutamate dehydrogenase (NAD(P)+)
MPVEGCRVIVQGFGNVGSNSAKLLWEKGYKIIGIGEYDGALYNANGIDIRAAEYKASGTDDQRLPGARPRQGRAADAQVRDPDSGRDRKRHHQPNADAAQGRILCEGANGPTTAVADEILADKGVFVIPDILANAGGVTTSYFEWVQDRMGYFWTEAKVNQRLERIMIDSFDDVLHYAEAHMASTTASRPTCWRSTAWRTPPSSAASTHRMLLTVAFARLD